MESWFLADKDCLRRFYGDSFKVKALPGHPVEEAPKKDVMDGLKNATQHGGTKGEYSKRGHSFEILERLDPEKVCAASPHAKRLIDTLREKTG